ncbi:conserved hypothetical protein [metagenome]|uniref:DUF559 domain-containing protein n=1 Tax=metagenome TaxID=256318 RepID=A0A2P2BYV4_9ZZZZ
MPYQWDPVCTPPRLVRPVRIDPSGEHGPTKSQAAGPRWRRTTPGLHVPSATDSERPEQRILEQSMRLPPGTGVTGWAGLRLFGAAFFDGLAPDGRTRLAVPLALGSRGRIRPHGQVELLYEHLPTADLTVRQGISTTTLLRSTFDAVRKARDDREAVVTIDMACAAGLISPERLRRAVSDRPGWRGIDRARRALELCSEHSRSPNETRLRLVWRLDARLPPPLVNCPIRSIESGRLLGIADLFDEEAGLVVEYDGADHRSARRHTADVDREDRLRRHDLEVVRVTGMALRDTAALVDRLLAARLRARHLPEHLRTWVAVPAADDLETRLRRREGRRREIPGDPLRSDDDQGVLSGRT